jgi:hypothetical protein
LSIFASYANDSKTKLLSISWTTPIFGACKRLRASAQSWRSPSWPRLAILRCFQHHRQFLKFCGLDLSTQQSGQFRGLTRLSKYGNAQLRDQVAHAG